MLFTYFVSILLSVQMSLKVVGKKGWIEQEKDVNKSMATRFCEMRVEIKICNNH